MINLYILLFSHNTSQFVITTIAGTGYPGSSGDGVVATDAQFSYIGGVTVDVSGNVYFTDTSNCAVRVIDKHKGILKTIAGVSGQCGSSGDGFAAVNTKLNNPSGIYLDSMNNVYITDSSNNKVRMVNSAGNIRTFAGTGTAGTSGDGHLAINAQLYNPSDVAIGLNGNVYIADTSNNKIRMVNSTGIIITFAGTGTYGGSGDGAEATFATLSNPSGVSADLFGNVYIADTFNNRIRVVNSVGIITTFAGGGYSMGLYGAHLAVEVSLSYPYGVKVDSSGNVYIADTSNNVVRLVPYDGSGIITTFAGVGMSGTGSGYLGDGGPASSGYLGYPRSVALDVSGALYIADTSDYRVRKVASTINYPTSQPSVQPSTPSSQPTLQPSSEPSKFVWQSIQQVCLFCCSL